METRDAAVLNLYECPRSMELMIEDNGGAVAPVEAFLAGCEEIFRSAWGDPETIGGAGLPSPQTQ